MTLNFETYQLVKVFLEIMGRDLHVRRCDRQKAHVSDCTVYVWHRTSQSSGHVLGAIWTQVALSRCTKNKHHQAQHSSRRTHQMLRWDCRQARDGFGSAGVYAQSRQREDGVRLTHHDEHAIQELQVHG